MSYTRAVSILHKEMMFLGLNWADLEHLLQEKPTTFPNSAVEAYAVYKEEISK